jgi:hypothetical protein
MVHVMPPALRRFADFLATNPSPVDVVAGKFYWVPCATHSSGKKWRGFRDGTSRSRHVPLVGTVHEDREMIKFDAWHIHVDTRFLSIPQRSDQRIQQEYNLLALATPLSLTDAWLDADKPSDWGDAVLSLRRLRARRAEPPVWDELTRWTRPLEDAYADASAACGTCPHKQIPLSAGRDMGNGVRQCPGHGLCWDREGRLVRMEEDDTVA